jgi:fatty acid synthase subunit alpha
LPPFLFRRRSLDSLSQLLQYLVVCRVSRLTPGDLQKRLVGTTGHSQGVVSAVAIAASSTYESFQENASKAIKWLFFSGCRAQQAFPVVSLEPAIVQDAVEDGEGVPSPMLSVTSLSLKDLESQINNANPHLPEGSKLFLSLHNGLRCYWTCSCVIRTCYVFEENSCYSWPGPKQNAILAAQSVFSVRFLVVSAPYHSMYMNEAPEKLFQEDLEGEELWRPEDLQMPVFHTESGLFQRPVCFCSLLIISCL